MKQPSNAFSPKNTIFYFPWGGYGDILLATAVLKKLQRFHRHTRIYCCNRKKIWKILQHNPLIDRFIPFPHLLFPKENLQVAMNNPKADPMIFFSAYGYFKPTQITPRRHAINVIGDMVGVKAELADMSVDFNEGEIDSARQLKKDIGKPFIILQANPISHPGKAWLDERWAEVVRFLNSHGTATVQVGCSGEKPIPGTVNLIGRNTILQDLALLTEAVFFMGIDSVFQHAAYALKVPALVLFGSSTPVVWGYSSHINLYKNLPCQPCIDEPLRICHEHRCMLQISTDEVIDVVRNLL